MTNFRTFRTVTLAVAFVTALSGAARADMISNSLVTPNGGASVVDNGTVSSSASLDANNYAKSFITPGTAIMGAAAATDGSAQPITMTTHQDNWWFSCGASSCATEFPLSKPIPLQVTFGIKVSETQVTGSAYLEFDASYALGTNGYGQFNFSFVQDGQGDFELQSTYVQPDGQVVDLPVDQTLVNGVYTLSATATELAQVCGLDGSSCIPSEMSCAPGIACSDTPAFTDTQSIEALIDPGQGEPDIIDGYDPFTIDITSLDPTYQFISGDGRTIGGAPTNSVPEPNSALLMASGLIILWWRHRRACR